MKEVVDIYSQWTKTPAFNALMLFVLLPAIPARADEPNREGEGALVLDVGTEDGLSEEGPVANANLEYILEKIEVVGNRKTLNTVILRDIDIQIGHRFAVDDPRLEKARYKLLSSGLFYHVDFSLRKGGGPGAVVLVVTVAERNTIVVQDVVFGLAGQDADKELADIEPYGSLDVAEKSFLGTGLSLSAAGAWSQDQSAYRVRLSESHFFNTDYGFHATGLFSSARDFFGNTQVCEVTCPCNPLVAVCPDTSLIASYRDYVVMKYNRMGLRLGTSYPAMGDAVFFIDYRLEAIDAAVPPAGSHVTFGERRPIVFGHLLPGNSFLSSLLFGMLHDSRDNFFLPSSGSRTTFEIEFSSELIGSNYDFAKFTLSHDKFFPLGKGHSLKLEMFGGIIMGESPFFNQFFVGDFSTFVPSRVLDLNFSPLQPNLLETSIVEMRYENIAASLGVEYSVPLLRGQGFFYGINAFVGLGVFALASQEYFRMDPRGYAGYRAAPMDLTMDLGIKIDTEVGLFVISMANLFRMIPALGRKLAE